MLVLAKGRAVVDAAIGAAVAGDVLAVGAGDSCGSTPTKAANLLLRRIYDDAVAARNLGFAGSNGVVAALVSSAKCSGGTSGGEKGSESERSLHNWLGCWSKISNELGGYLLSGQGQARVAKFMACMVAAAGFISSNSVTSDPK